MVAVSVELPCDHHWPSTLINQTVDEQVFEVDCAGQQSEPRVIHGFVGLAFAISFDDEIGQCGAIFGPDVGDEGMHRTCVFDVKCVAAIEDRARLVVDLAVQEKDVGHKSIGLRALTGGISWIIEATTVRRTVVIGVGEAGNITLDTATEVLEFRDEINAVVINEGEMVDLVFDFTRKEFERKDLVLWERLVHCGLSLCIIAFALLAVKSDEMITAIVEMSPYLLGWTLLLIVFVKLVKIFEIIALVIVILDLSSLAQ